MRFANIRDYQTMLTFNKELINVVVDTPVIVYKLNIGKTTQNIYGEGTSKTWYRGVVVPCLIARQPTDPQTEINVVDVVQSAEFAFLRNELESRGILPETGDIIEFNSSYYEIENTNQVQLWAGQDIYDHQLLCETHLMRKTPSQLERPLV
jgi:hypothetical protein